MEFSFTLMHGRTVSTCVCDEIRDKNTQSEREKRALDLGKKGGWGIAGKKGANLRSMLSSIYTKDRNLFSRPPFSLALLPHPLLCEHLLLLLLSSCTNKTPFRRRERERWIENTSRHLSSSHARCCLRLRLRRGLPGDAREGDGERGGSCFDEDAGKQVELRRSLMRAKSVHNKRHSVSIPLFHFILNARLCHLLSIAGSALPD